MNANKHSRKAYNKKADRYDSTLDGFGVDVAEKMVENAKKLNPDMEFHARGCTE